VGSKSRKVMPITLAALILLGIAIIGVYVAVADRFCPIESTPNPPTFSIGQYRENYEHQTSDGRYGHANHHEDQSSHFALIVLTHAEAERREGYEQPTNEGTKPHGWIVKFFCEAKAADAALVLFTYWLMLVTGWLVWATLGLRDSTEKLWDAGERQIKLSRSVAAVQARNTRRQLKHAEDTAERQLRAYIGVESGAIMLNYPNQGQISAFVRIKNNGSTPAYDVAGWSSFDIRPSNETHPYEKQGVARSKTLLGPTITLDQQCILNVTDEQVESIIGRSSKIYFWGRWDYLDAFKKERFLAFRFSMDGDMTNVAFVELRGMGWGLIPEPNGYDAN
jgi:hypothetical protein